MVSGQRVCPELPAHGLSRAVRCRVWQTKHVLCSSGVGLSGVGPAKDGDALLSLAATLGVWISRTGGSDCMDSRQVITYWVLCFVSIFAVINPLRVTSLTALFTEGWADRQRKAAVHRALIVAAIVLFSAAWTGNHLIIRSGIHLGGFRIASGLLLLAIVIPRMARDRPLSAVFTKHTGSMGLNETRALDLGLFPLAFPLLCGIAPIATVTLYSGEPTELWRRVTTLAALALTLAVAGVMMRIAPRVHGFMGERGSRYTSHVLDMSVAAWAIDFSAVGVRDLLPLVLSTPPAGG